MALIIILLLTVIIPDTYIRGRIFDRKGRVLVDNQLAYSLSIQPRLVNQEELPILLSRLTN